MPNIITTNEALAILCERASKRAFVIIDTEFVRTRTLYPQLGLIQLNDGHEIALIDPLAITDPEPLKALLTQSNCVKVLHACSEDFEALWSTYGVIPEPVFDTQFAAHVVGIGATMGYANMVETILGISVDKGESRTNWLARPLADAQLNYAENDVRHLLPAYEHIVAQLSAEQIDIVLSESTLIGSKKAASMPPEYTYLLIKNNWRLNAKQRFVLKQLASWRIQRARDKNMAVNFVLREGVMLNVATALPQSKTALSKVSGITPQELRMVGANLVTIVTEALKQFEDDALLCAVPAIKRLSELKGYKPTMAKIKTCVQTAAETAGIPPEIISSKKQIHQLLKYHWFEIDETRAQGLTPDLQVGWRQSLIGDEVVKIAVEGR